MKDKYRQKFTNTFSIDFHSKADDQRYFGNFTCKKLSISDVTTLGVRKAQLNGGMHHDSDNPGMGVDAQTDEFNSMIAHLEVSLVAKPQWWDFEKISDFDLIAKVFEEVVSFETSFLRSGDTEGTSERVDVGDGEGNSESRTQGSDNTGVHSPVVVSEVQAALEP